MNQVQIQLMAFNHSTWDLMKQNMEDVGRFLATNVTDIDLDKEVNGDGDIPTLIAMSIKLVLSELILYAEDYEKYPVREYSDEDFVEMVINIQGNDIPDVHDSKGNEVYFDGLREIMWGHIKGYANKLSEILMVMDDPDKFRDDMDEMKAGIFLECLTVCWVECVLRKREAYILEQNYEE